MSQKKEVTAPCEYHSLVECPVSCRNCNTCGWNPKVERYRRLEAKEKIAEVMGGNKK